MLYMYTPGTLKCFLSNQRQLSFLSTGFALVPIPIRLFKRFLLFLPHLFWTEFWSFRVMIVLENLEFLLQHLLCYCVSAFPLSLPDSASQKQMMINIDQPSSLPRLQHFAEVLVPEWEWSPDPLARTAGRHLRTGAECVTCQLSLNFILRDLGLKS